jgi:hypothetical protein
MEKIRFKANRYFQIQLELLNLSENFKHNACGI